MRTAQWSRFGTSETPDGMVLIPSGTNAGTDSDYGAYSLTATAFYMAATVISYNQWSGPFDDGTENGYVFDNAVSTKPGGANLPVQRINWYDCVQWCNPRSQMEGRASVSPPRGCSSPFTRLGKWRLSPLIQRPPATGCPPARNVHMRHAVEWAAATASAGGAFSSGHAGHFVQMRLCGSDSCAAAQGGRGWDGALSGPVCFLAKNVEGAKKRVWCPKRLGALGARKVAARILDR